MNPDDQNLPGIQLIDVAVEIARSLETSECDKIAAAAAVNYASLGLLDDALASVREISDSYSVDTAIAQTAVNVTASEPESEVLSLVDSIEDPGIQNLALEQVSVRYAEHSLFDAALEVSGRLEDRDAALARIIPLVAEKESLEWSDDLVNQFNDSNLRTTCLIELATIAKNSHRSEQAEHFLILAEAEAENQSAAERVLQLVAIADVYDELSQTEKAIEILLRAFRLGDEIDGPADVDFGNGFSRDEAMVQVAGGFARCGRSDQADLAIERIEGPLAFARASTQQAIGLYKDGHRTQASQLLSEAEELIASEPCLGSRTSRVRDIAFYDLALGNGAIGNFKKGLQVAFLISDPEQQLATLIELGKSAALAGSTDSIHQIHDEVNGDYQRAMYLLEVSDSLRKADHKEVAVRLLLRAIEDADKIQRTDQKCLVLIQISSGLFEGGLESKAKELLLAVLNTAVDIQDGYQQARILLAMSEECRKRARQLSSDEKEILGELAILPR